MIHFLLFIAFLFGQTADLSSREREVKILKKVQNVAVTNKDIESYVDFILFVSGLKNTNDNRKKVTSKAKALCIKNRLKIQTALKSGLSISNAEIMGHLTHMLANNGGGIDNFKGQLLDKFSRTDALKAFKEKVKAEMSWNAIIKDTFSKLTGVNPQEVEAYQKKCKANQNCTHYDLYEISIQANSTNRADKKKLMNDIIHNLKNGARFAWMATLYSDAPNAKDGGHKGTVSENDLEVSDRKVLSQMTVGQVTPIIKTSKGYTLYYVANKYEKGKSVKVQLTQALLPLTGNMDQVIVDYLSTQKNTKDFVNAAKENNLQIEKTPLMDLSMIQQKDMRAHILKMKKGNVINFPMGPNAQMVMMLSKKEIKSLPMPKTDELKETLRQKKLNKISDRELNKLYKELGKQNI